MMDGDLPPATGAWHEGDPVGRRQFADLPGPIRFEQGGVLPGIRVAYETWGTPAPDRSNAVLVEHALTGDAHVVGPAGPGQPTAGWWDGLIGPGRALDTDRLWVVCANIVGGCQGTTGPASLAPDGRPWGPRFPQVTIRDQVAVEALLADALGIERWALVLGGSMGGMRVLEWAIEHPGRVAGALVLAAGARATADQIGLQTTQVRAITSDAAFRGGDYYDAGPGGGPHVGMGIARRIAHLSYRAEIELDSRFGNHPQADEVPEAGGRYAVQSYLDHHDDKLVRRFDANSYVVLTESMNSHDVGRGRGGIPDALARITARTLVAGIDSDRLYPLRLQRELADLIPTSGALHVVHSDHGHDGFLIEVDAVGKLVTDLLG